MQILFDHNGSPISPGSVKASVLSFGKSYSAIVREVIEKTESNLDKSHFCENVSKLLQNFKMTRRGPFHGVKYENKKCHDPKGIVALCWSHIGEDLIQLKELMLSKRCSKHGRVLAEVGEQERAEIITRLNAAFEKLRSTCTGKATSGHVAASKILFAVLPEIALPVDNAQWRDLFNTTDYSVIISGMVEEILKWEMATGCKLDQCDSYDKATLPSVYNVMAMKARPSINSERRTPEKTITLDALIELLERKGIITRQELLEV